MVAWINFPYATMIVVMPFRIFTRFFTTNFILMDICKIYFTFFHDDFPVDLGHFICDLQVIEKFLFWVIYWKIWPVGKEFLVLRMLTTSKLFLGSNQLLWGGGLD